MIVCAIDDLLFSIKIKHVAKHLGVDLYFERSAERIVDTVRDQQPSLVIFDLNSAKLNPLAAIAAMKADPALAMLDALDAESEEEELAQKQSTSVGRVVGLTAMVIAVVLALVWWFTRTS